MVGEAGTQAKNLLGEARTQLTDQAAQQQNNLATWISSIVDELDGMVNRSEDGDTQSGAATSLVRQVSSRARSAAGWLENHEPADLLTETSRFARQRPGMFLALAAVGGLVAGRLTRGLTADAAPSTSSASPAAIDVGSHADIDPSGRDADHVRPRGGPAVPGRRDLHRAGCPLRVRARLGRSMTDQPGYGAATRARPESHDRPIGEVFSAVTSDLSTLIRQEVALAKAEVRQSATQAGGAAGKLAGAGVAGHMVLLFVSVSAWWGLGQFIGNAWSALVVAAFWAIVGAVLYRSGRAQLGQVEGLPRTTETTKQIPPALAGHEETS